MSGRIVTQARTNDGKELLLDAYEPGDVFGVVGVLDFGPRPVDATAETRSELFRLERRQFLKHLQSSPELCFRVLSLLCNDLRATTEALEDSVLYTLPARLAKKLVTLAGINHGNSTNDPLLLRISHNELARHLGVHRVSVSRVLSDWEKAGFLSSGRQKIEISNLQALSDVSAPVYSTEFNDQLGNVPDFAGLSAQKVFVKQTVTRVIEDGKDYFRGILAVDTEDYSQSLANDAVGTLKHLKSAMQAVDTAIAARNGRLISHSGDRVLADFQSVDKALEAALSIHERVNSLRFFGSGKADSIFRIGVHYGEVQATDGSYLVEASILPSA